MVRHNLTYTRYVCFEYIWIQPAFGWLKIENHISILIQQILFLENTIGCDTKSINIYHFHLYIEFIHIFQNVWLQFGIYAERLCVCCPALHSCFVNGWPWYADTSKALCTPPLHFKCCSCNRCNSWRRMWFSTLYWLISVACIAMNCCISITRFSSFCRLRWCTNRSAATVLLAIGCVAAMLFGADACRPPSSRTCGGYLCTNELANRVAFDDRRDGTDPGYLTERILFTVAGWLE